MTRRITFTLAGALLSLAVALPAGSALAQQKQQVSFKVPAENNKYIVAQNVELGDAPNHIVRLFEVQSRLPNNTPAINGLKPVELRYGGSGDLTEGNGNGISYSTILMENGDKFFTRNAMIVQNVSGKITATHVGRITGGTGRLAGIGGNVRQVIIVDPRPGGTLGDAEYDIEYSIAK
jgi:hypothetical protein